MDTCCISLLAVDALIHTPLEFSKYLLSMQHGMEFDIDNRA